jgi:carboxyl-terminal processing protease
VSDALVEEFITAGEADEIKRDDEGLKASGAFIRRQLKALMANQLWGISEYYQCINDNNPIVKEALIQMKSDSFKRLKLRF